MMRTFDDLCRAIADDMHEMPATATKEELLVWVESHPRLPTLAKLAKVYLDAESNPPEGIIGVGAITYAEQMLQAAQS